MISSIESCVQYPPATWILLILGRRVGKRGHVFIHEGAEAQPEVAGELPHLLGQLGAQVPDGFQVVLHGQREVHQVVEVHRVVLHLPHLQAKPRLVSWMSRWREFLSCFTCKYVNYSKGNFFLTSLVLVQGFSLTLNVYDSYPAADWGRFSEA